jgi:hypothetical protein
VHILKLNQGTTTIEFSGLHHAALTLLSAEENFKKSKSFLNYPSYKSIIKILLRHRSYCRWAVAVHVLKLNQGSTPIKIIELPIAAITLLSLVENFENLKEVMNYFVQFAGCL